MAQLKIVPVSYQRQRFIYVADTRGISIACVTRQQNSTQSTIFPSRQWHIHVKKMREFYGKNSQVFFHRFIYFLSRMHKQLMRVQVAKEEIQQIYIKKVQKVVYSSKFTKKIHMFCSGLFMSRPRHKMYKQLMRVYCLGSKRGCSAKNGNKIVYKKQGN